MTTTTRAVQESRPHDYIYDPLFSVAGPVDHFRAQPPPGIERLPNRKNFFSEGRNYPRFEYRLKLDDKVPTFVDRAWRGPEGPHNASYRDVSGSNLLRYFKRPLVPLMQSVGPELVYSKQTVSEATAKEVERQRTRQAMETMPLEELSAVRTVGVQSDYRESEAQTDPFSPDFVVPEGTDPEILAIRELKFVAETSPVGQGLPAGLKDIEYIDRVRRRRAIEASLPPLTDAKSMNERQQILEELEWTEWREREDEIEALQAERLNLFRTAVEEFDTELEERTEQRIESLKNRLNTEKEEKFGDIQKKRIKTLRKLAKSRRDVEKQNDETNIIEDYANFGSTKYVPVTREGFVPEKGSKLNEQDFLDSLNPSEVLDFDRTLPTHTMKATIQRPNRTTLKSTFSRKSQQHSKHLDRMEQKIKAAKAKKSAEEDVKDDILAAYRTVVRIRRPPTPSVEREMIVDESEEKRANAIVFLQRLLRGRAIQNMMFEGKEKRLELIQEIRSVEGLQRAEQQMKDNEAVELGKTKDLQQAHEENVYTGAMRRIQGAVVAQTLDLLAKELSRYREERRLEAMVRLAERERNRREAEEGGRRQRVFEQRAKEDERFRGLLTVHQETAQSYLRFIMRGAATEAAERKARREAEIKSTTLSSILNTLEERYNDPEAVVKDLFYAFLLPEVQRRELRSQVAEEQRSLQLAAREAYVDTKEAAGFRPAAKEEPL